MKEQLETSSVRVVADALATAERGPGVDPFLAIGDGRRVVIDPPSAAFRKVAAQFL